MDRPGAPLLRRRYRDDAQALLSLVRSDAVHRDVYVDAEVYELEMERLWSRTWVYVGHDSQVPQAGDYATADVAGRPVILVRVEDGTVRVLMNRCAHKGAKLVSEASGHAGSFFRCPYHAWAYDLDGAIRAIPLRAGYEGTRLNRLFAPSVTLDDAVRLLTPVIERYSRERGSGERFGDWCDRVVLPANATYHSVGGVA